MDKFDTVVAFGDSFSSQCGTLYNETTAALELNRRTWTDFKSGLRGNPIFDNCSVNGGLNYLNYLTNCTQNGIDPLTCPKRLVSLAFGGAQAAPGENYIASDILPQEGQMRNWANHVKPDLGFRPESTLVSFSYGLNDLTILKEEGYAQLYDTGEAYKIEVEISRRISSVQQSMDSLYNDGLRHFLVFNVPLDIPEVAALILEWNRLLESVMLEFQIAHPTARVYLMDTFTLLNKITDDPSRYQLTDISNSCHTQHSLDSSFDCSATSTFLMMDWIHWTPRAHVILAEAVEELLASMTQKGWVNTMGSISYVETTGPPAYGYKESTIDVALYKLKSTLMDNSLAAIAILIGVSIIGILTLFYTFYKRLPRKNPTVKRDGSSSRRYAPLPDGEAEEGLELQSSADRFDMDEETS